LAVFIAFGFAIIAYQTVRTLQQLTPIEADRDRWQRSAEIISALNLKQDSTVVDLGCGSGYFALKLSPVVDHGWVYGVDIRQVSLRFLQLRALIRARHNIRIVLGEPNNSHLPQKADAVLIANTYHELDHPDAILNQVSQSLVPGGRLVIVDPRQTEHGEVSPSHVEDELRSHGFEITSSETQFVHQPGGAEWWLIVARKP
jgi:ubiquinone/menaquinone biosynthesis C-methylase UbiE